MATSLCCFFSGCNTHCGKCPTDTVLVRARFAGRIDGLSHRSSIAVLCQFSAIAKVVYGGANVFFGFSYVAWRTAGCALFLREVFRAHLSGCKNALRRLLTGTSFFLGCASVGPGNCPAEERCGVCHRVRMSCLTSLVTCPSLWQGCSRYIAGHSSQSSGWNTANQGRWCLLSLWRRSRSSYRNLR